MADIAFYINNQPVPPPEGWEGMEIEVNFLNDSPDASIKTTTFTWMGENAKLLNEWKTNGLISGGLGIWEGPPLRIEMSDTGTVVFDGCIDMTSPETTFQCDIVKASCKETTRIQFLRDRAQIFNFALLKNLKAGEAGRITKQDYIAVPYVISLIPDWLASAILGTSLLQLVTNIQSSIQTLEEIAEKTVIDIPPAAIAIADFVSPGAVALGVLTILWDSILFALYIAYTAFIVALSISILLLVVNNIMQPLKYKYGMKVSTLFEKACEYLNLGFSSTILQQAPYNKLVIIPQKSAYINDFYESDNFLYDIFGTIFNRKQYSDDKNKNAYGYYDGTFAQLIAEMEDYFNVKDQASGLTGMTIRDNVLHFERWDYWNNQAAFTMPNQSTDAPFEDPYTTNASEIAGNYLVAYQQDSQDQNTYDQYNGTTCQMMLRPKTVSNEQNVLLKNLTTKNLNYSLAKRKTDFTIPEKIIDAMFDMILPIYNTIAHGFNVGSFHVPGAGGQTISGVIDKREGAMLLSSDFTGMQKILVVTEPSDTVGGGVPVCKIDPNNSREDSLGYTDAYYLQKNFHSASWAVNTLDNTFPNQYLKFPQKTIPLCASDFSLLRTNNVIKSYDQKPGRIDSMRWRPAEETAECDFRIKEVYSTNLTQTIVIDGQV